MRTVHSLGCQERALRWLRVLECALDAKLPYLDREARLRAFYVCLYGLPASQQLPDLPELLHRDGLARGDVASSMGSLKINLAEALRQVSHLDLELEVQPGKQPTASGSLPIAYVPSGQGEARSTPFHDNASDLLRGLLPAKTCRGSALEHSCWCTSVVRA